LSCGAIDIEFAGVTIDWYALFGCAVAGLSFWAFATGRCFVFGASSCKCGPPGEHQQCHNAQANALLEMIWKVKASIHLIYSSYQPENASMPTNGSTLSHTQPFVDHRKNDGLPLDNREVVAIVLHGD
jgi:hypothetical protein